MSLYRLTALEVGKRIKEIRINLGKTMDEFAELIDEKATKGTVNKWEHGKNYPNKKRLKKIAEVGNVSIKYLTTEIKEFPKFRLFFDIEEDDQLIRYMNWDIYEKIKDTSKYKEKHSIDSIIPYEDLGDYLAILERNYMLVKKDK